MKKKTKALPKLATRREHRVTFMLNDEEYQVIKQHILKYKITNQSNWYRTTILSHVLKVMEEDYPTLFNEHEMRR
ncbi:MAG: hypothetical protein LBR49_04800 [Tannerella sp.]|jgi:hypothetical protein|nr:hypothetical protein [Tannerella sp.]